MVKLNNETSIYLTINQSSIYLFCQCPPGKRFPMFRINKRRKTIIGANEFPIDVVNITLKKSSWYLLPSRNGRLWFALLPDRPGEISNTANLFRHWTKRDIKVFSLSSTIWIKERCRDQHRHDTTSAGDGEAETKGPYR